MTYKIIIRDSNNSNSDIEVEYNSNIEAIAFFEGMKEFSSFDLYDQINVYALLDETGNLLVGNLDDLS